jgi:hypothetical protein
MSEPKSDEQEPSLEREGDRRGGPRVNEMVEAYERTLARALTTKDLAKSLAMVHRFRESVVQGAGDEWEIECARRLALSAQLFVITTLRGSVDEAATVAGELVMMPTQRRMAQLWQIVAFAGYCAKHGRADAAWPHLRRAIHVVETEIPTHEGWLAARENIYDIRQKLWEAMTTEQRMRLGVPRGG